MKARYGVLAGLGIGYLLGSKAGRERYEQMRERWQAMAESPAVQQTVEPIKEAVEPIAEKLEELVESRTGTNDLPTRGLASLSADQMKERLARTGSVSDAYQTHPPEEIIKERM